MKSKAKTLKGTNPMIIDHRWTYEQFLRRMRIMDLKLRYLLRDPQDVDANRALADEIARREKRDRKAQNVQA